MVETVRGLRKALRLFEYNGKYARNGHWEIAKGGYDLYWQLSYKRIPVIDCVCNVLQNDCLSKDEFRKVTKIILDEYNTNRWEPMRAEEVRYAA